MLIAAINAQKVFVSLTCYMYVYRTTLFGLENVSAHEMVKVIQRWVSSGPAVKIQWYVVDIVKSCPVAIPSDVYAECVSPDKKQCGNDKPQ